MSERNNAFDHLRLLGALSVLVSHAYGLLQIPAPWPLGIIGAWGVDVFFVISGYMNAHSLFARQSVPVFLACRALRIYPALIFCVLFMVGLGAVITSVPLDRYFSSQTAEFAWRNAGLFFGQREDLPGVFEHNPLQGLNASLWTLPIEGRFYLYLALGLALIRYTPKIAVIVGAAAVVALAIRGVDISYDHPAERLGLLFGAGLFVAGLERAVRTDAAVLALIGAAVLFFCIRLTTAGTLAATAAAVIVVGRAKMPSPLRLPCDISYGFYIFAFPIQQLTIFWGMSLLPGLLTSLVLTTAIATLSAIWVERPALALAQRLKQRRALRFATAAPQPTAAS